MRIASLLLILALGPLSAADRYPVPGLPADYSAPPAKALTTPSGLAYVVLKPGDGKGNPNADGLVTIEFTVWTGDGKLLDSTGHLDGPLTRPIGRLLKGMGEGLQLMSAGEKRRLWLPPALGRPGGMLVMDLELVSFEPSPFQAPLDVTGPTGSVRLTKSGLAMRTLREGQGTTHPGKHDEVKVHYSGWTTDGHLFDSSWKNAQPVRFRLDEVIRGWTEGVQLMVVGEKTRFWVPENLAYHGEHGKPAGTLVFDIELLSIEK